MSYRELKDMKVGDIIRDKEGGRAKVIDILPNSFLLSQHTIYDAVSRWVAFKQAKKLGYEIEQPKKLTKSEIEKKLGHSVEIVEE